MTQSTPDNITQAPIDILEALERDLEKRQSTPGMPTGIQAVDDLIWGLHKGELLVVGARPSHGKTSFSLQIAWNLAKRNVPTIFVSLEMSKQSILERIFCNEYEVHGWRLRKGFDAEIKKFQDNKLNFRNALEVAPFWIVDNFGRSINEIQSLLENFKPQAVFIDHAQKISSRGFGSKYDALSDYAHRLQDLAIKYNCAVVLNSQVNRGGEFLKGSGDLEECADTLIRCHWPHKDDPAKFPYDEYQVSVEKQKHGPCDVANINFNAGFYRFYQKSNDYKKSSTNVPKKIISWGIDN